MYGDEIEPSLDEHIGDDVAFAKPPELHGCFVQHVEGIRAVDGVLCRVSSGFVVVSRRINGHCQVSRAAEIRGKPAIAWYTVFMTAIGAVGADTESRIQNKEMLVNDPVG